MEFQLSDIDPHAGSYEVKSAFARILHSEMFQVPPGSGGRINFRVGLHKRKTLTHNGTVPSREIGEKLLRIIDRRPVVVGSRRICLRINQSQPRPELIQMLQRVPYQDPVTDRERDDILRRLKAIWHVDDIQFGLWLRKPVDDQNGVFACEWSANRKRATSACLHIDYQTKSIRISMRDMSNGDLGAEAIVVMKFSIIQNIWFGYERSAFICFELNTPPIFESTHHISQLEELLDLEAKRLRIAALNEKHRHISPYAHQVRVTLMNNDASYTGNSLITSGPLTKHRTLSEIDLGLSELFKSLSLPDVVSTRMQVPPLPRNGSSLEEFPDLCEVAGLRRPTRADIISEQHHFLSSEQLMNVQQRLTSFQGCSWAIRFQVENMLRRGIITTETFLKQMNAPFRRLINDYPDDAGRILRNFTVQMLPGQINVVESFESYLADVNKKITSHSSLTSANEGRFSCHSVSFTPTRLLLEGPHPLQSNRILRQFVGYQDYFLRVDFREEDRLQFRWSYRVDGRALVKERVGETLKRGFDLAGRHFEFLGYSSSALREHSTWFVSPFDHPQKGRVTAARIRREAGDFSKLLCYPAKYAARLSQTLSATMPSVSLSSDQWELIDDLGLHSDGVGTFSQKLGNRIWKTLCARNSKLKRKVEPSAYQIRFLGFKGVIVLDETLEGIRMCPRKSMKKFESHIDGSAEIEIANAFHSPGLMHLNRSMVMILEDLGVEKGVFLDLLHRAMNGARDACNDIHGLTRELGKHRFNDHFGLRSTLCRLADPTFNLSLDPSSSRTTLRELQYRCRIPVPQSWNLVGVADEGRAYIEREIYDEEDVFTLSEGEIFADKSKSLACVQEDKESGKIYLTGSCWITRSPMYFPGDIQMVTAIGEPPKEKICAFRNLVNVVVFPSIGERSFTSRLSGGDLDGDKYDVSTYPPLQFSRIVESAEFPAVEQMKIEEELLWREDPRTGVVRIDPEQVIPYVCDFVTEYINSNYLGMLSDRHLVIADQSQEGVFDRRCIELARLCNQAVDYPRNGHPVDISSIPKRLFNGDPDWKKREGNSNSESSENDFYPSQRAIGEIYRQCENARGPNEMVDKSKTPLARPAESHPVYAALKPRVEAFLNGVNASTKHKVESVFRRFKDELICICATHSLSESERLSEAEVVVGTILAQSTQPRRRSEEIYRMNLHLRDVEAELTEIITYGKEWERMSEPEVKQALEFSWSAWKLMTDDIARMDDRDIFGKNSFTLLMLDIIFECLGRLKAL